jgi:hypothetical protein
MTRAEQQRHHPTADRSGRTRKQNTHDSVQHSGDIRQAEA